MRFDRLDPDRNLVEIDVYESADAAQQGYDRP